MRDPIAIVGRGRLGRTLALLLAHDGREIALVPHTEPVPARFATVLLCVPDAHVRATAAALAVGPVVLHCSGALGLDVLEPHPPERRGSFHPLMTFPGPEIAIPELTRVPAAIDGGPEARRTARALALDLGMEPLELSGDRRLYHAAAVMAGNFATVLLAEAGRVLAAAGVDPERAPALLAPLAIASIRNAAATSPRRALTGPIARGDRQTIEAHLAALGDHDLDEIVSLYETLVRHGVALRLPPERAGGGVS